MKFNNDEIRRQDRQLDEKRAFEILKEGEYGVLSMQEENGEGAYGVPLSYVWDRGNSIYIHCAPPVTSYGVWMPATRFPSA